MQASAVPDCWNGAAPFKTSPVMVLALIAPGPHSLPMQTIRIFNDRSCKQTKPHVKICVKGCGTHTHTHTHTHTRTHAGANDKCSTCSPTQPICCECISSDAHRQSRCFVFCIFLTGDLLCAVLDMFLAMIGRLRPVERPISAHFYFAA